MSQDWSVRLPEPVKVLLYCNGIPVCAGKTQQIGNDSFFIKTRSEMHKLVTSFEVAFQAPVYGRRRWYRLSAFVRELSEHGYGLQIVSFKNNALIAWQSLLRSGEAENMAEIMQTIDASD